MEDNGRRGQPCRLRSMIDGMNGPRARLASASDRSSERCLYFSAQTARLRFLSRYEEIALAEVASSISTGPSRFFRTATTPRCSYSYSALGSQARLSDVPTERDRVRSVQRQVVHTKLRSFTLDASRCYLSSACRSPIRSSVDRGSVDPAKTIIPDELFAQLRFPAYQRV